MAADRHVSCWNGASPDEGGWLSAPTGFWESQDVGTVFQRLQEDSLWAAASRNANFLQTWVPAQQKNTEAWVGRGHQGHA